ncbi:MAG: YigZ family protein [Lachnospiraceae bacterium]
MSDVQKIVYEGGVGEIVEKKSRFIASVYAVHSEEEAAGIIEGLKKKYWDARHNCYAFVLGNNNEIQRYSDDGEPGGTAGKPILEVILGENIRDCLIVVTRYFGGTLLGTGGLVRAYQQSVKEGISASVIAVKNQGIIYGIETDYNNIGKIQYATGEFEGAFILESEYGEKVELNILVESDRETSYIKKITELLNGKVSPVRKNAAQYIVSDGRAIIL